MKAARGLGHKIGAGIHTQGRRMERTDAAGKSAWCGAILALIVAWGAPARAAEYLELTDLRLIDGTGAGERRVARLIARDGVIVAIDAQGAVPVPEADARWTRIGLDGAWVTPGLIETHAHVARFPDTRNEAQRLLHQAARGGVTGVRDLGGDARALADIARSLQAREWIGPHLSYSAMFGGPALFESGPTAALAPGHAPGTAPWSRKIEAGTDLSEAVAQAQGSGADNIKVYGDLSPAQARGLIEQARRRGLRSTAHATVFPTRPSELVEAGIGTLSHSPYLVWEAVDTVPADFKMRTQGPWKRVPPDHPRLLALYRRMAERGVFLDSTLYVYRSMKRYSAQIRADWADEAFAWGAKATAIARREGVRVTAGTDWFEPDYGETLPHTHDELALLVEFSGFTPMQALLAGTRDGAAALGLQDATGTVEVGKSADLMVLDADPLADIRNTRKLRMTVRGGQVLLPQVPPR